MRPLWELCEYEGITEYNKRFLERREWIKVAYDELIQKEPYRQYSENFELNDWIVSEVVERYFKEVGRIKAFHEVEKTSPAKLAAYLAIWIVRLSPVQILVKLNDDNKHLRYINEDLAISLAVGIFSFYFEEFKLTELIRENLRYHLRYRVLHADNFAMVFEGYEAVYRLFRPDYPRQNTED